MKAKIKPGYDNIRKPLKDIIPADTPFTLFISPSQLCNFKCHFCSHSLSIEEKKKAGFVSINQDFKVFKKIAEQSKEFPNKYKRILLTGLGEPLLNPKIVDMVRLLNEYEIAEKLEIFTNASLLKPELSDGLIDAGLTRLRISVQGTDAEKYKKHCGINLNFKKFVDGIRYFYEKSRGKCSIYIKIIEEELYGEDDKQKFFDIFGGICDEIFVENLVRAQPMMGDYDEKIPLTRTFYGEIAQKRDVCPYIFYTLQTDSEGNCYPCPPLSLPLNFSLGNIFEQPLRKIWTGEKMQKLRLSHLKKDGSKYDICKKCTNYLCFTPEEDNLDNHTHEIIKKIEGSSICQE